MKKQIALLLATAILLGLTACGGGGGQTAGSAGDEAGESAGTEAAKGKTETVELTVDNFFDYFEFRNTYYVDSDDGDIYELNAYVLRDGYTAELPEEDEGPAVTVKLSEDSAYYNTYRDVEYLSDDGTYTIGLYGDDYNYTGFWLSEGIMSGTDEISWDSESFYTLTAVSGSLTISTAADAEAKHPVVEEVSDFQPVVLADAEVDGESITVTLNSMTKITAEYDGEEPAQARIYTVTAEGHLEVHGYAKLNVPTASTVVYLDLMGTEQTQESNAAVAKDVLVTSGRMDELPTDSVTAHITATRIVRISHGDYTTEENQTLFDEDVTLPW